MNQKKSSGQGGARPGAGRKKGSANKRTREIADRAMRDGITPLEYLLKILRDEAADMKDRFAAATAAAPYVHPRLAAVEHNGSLAVRHEDALAALAAASAEEDDGPSVVTH